MLILIQQPMSSILVLSEPFCQFCVSIILRKEVRHEMERTSDLVALTGHMTHSRENTDSAKFLHFNFRVTSQPAHRGLHIICTCVYV